MNFVFIFVPEYLYMGIDLEKRDMRTWAKSWGKFKYKFRKCCPFCTISSVDWICLVWYLAVLVAAALSVAESNGLQMKHWQMSRLPL